MNNLRLVCPQCHNDVVTVTDDIYHGLTLIHCEVCGLEFAACKDDYYHRGGTTAYRIVELINYDWTYAYTSQLRLEGDTE